MSNLYTTIQQALEKYGAQLVTMFGSINPYVGAGFAALLLIGLIYLGYKATQENWADEENQSGSTTGGEVGNDQNTTNNVLNSGGGFFGEPTGVQGSATGVQGATGAAPSGATGVGQ